MPHTPCHPGLASTMISLTLLGRSPTPLISCPAVQVVYMVLVPIVPVQGWIICHLYHLPTSLRPTFTSNIPPGETVKPESIPLAALILGVGLTDVMDEDVMRGSEIEVDDDVDVTDDEELTTNRRRAGLRSVHQLAGICPHGDGNERVCPKICPLAFNTRSAILVPAAKSTGQFIAVAVAGVKLIS